MREGKGFGRESCERHLISSLYRLGGEQTYLCRRRL